MNKLENIQNIEKLMESMSEFLIELKQIEAKLLKIGSESKSKELKRKIEEIENLILTNVEKLMQTKTDCINLINQIEDESERLYLLGKFINRKSNKEIADMIGYSIRNTYYIQNRAIKHFLELEKREKESVK